MKGDNKMTANFATVTQRQFRKAKNEIMNRLVRSQNEFMINKSGESGLKTVLILVSKRLSYGTRVDLHKICRTLVEDAWAYLYVVGESSNGEYVVCDKDDIGAMGVCTSALYLRPVEIHEKEEFFSKGLGAAWKPLEETFIALNL